jgi:uncharacterized protein (TIGR00251 family)
MLTTLKVHVIPNARRNELSAISREEIRLKVRAQAQDGKANAEVIRFLAELIDCRKSRIAIKKGEKKRIKIIEIAGINPEAVWGKLANNSLPGSNKDGEQSPGYRAGEKQ